MIQTDKGVTGLLARKIRRDLEMPQKEFWGRIGVGHCGGARLEKQSDPLRTPERMLLFINYVLGIDTRPLVDLSAITPSFVAQLRKEHGKSQHLFWEAVGATQEAGCRWELGQRRMPIPIKTLVALRWVHGVPLTAGTKSEAAELKTRLTNIQGDKQ